MDDHQRNQYRHEIKWLENKIADLVKQLHRKPSKQKEIDTLRMQIRKKEYQIELGI